MGISFTDALQTRAAHLVNFASLKYQTRRTLSGSVSNQEMLLLRRASDGTFETLR